MLDSTSAYTVFPHQGIRMRPYEVLRVVDRQGNLRAYFVNKRDWTTNVAETCIRSVIDE